MKRVEKKSLTIWNLMDLQRALGYLLILGIGFYFFGDYTLVKKGLFIATGFVLFNLIKELILNYFDYLHTFYEVTEKAVYIKEGGWTIWETTVPIHRIQHLDTSQSFYARMFDLYSLNLYTAGDDHSIQYLKKEVTDSLHQQILEKLKTENEQE